MIYSSIEFCILFALVFSGYMLFPGQRSRFWLLTIASLGFYAWAGLFDLLVFLFVVSVSYLAAFLAEKMPAHRKAFISAGVAVMIAHLFFWKYFPWIVSSLQTLWPGFLGGRSFHLHLPLGISFFTFTGMGFLMDYYRDAAGLMTFRDYLLFHSFFAHLIAGPIVRAEQLLPQLQELRGPSEMDVAIGISLCARGLFKKMVIADRMGPFVAAVFAAPAKCDRHALLWALAAAFTQLWADFSGYTDMGRGTARLLGIHLPESFSSPLLCRRPSELWERWNVTFTRWMKDYVWYSIAGIPASIVIMMILVGLWHGATWGYLLWGFYLGALVMVERLITRSPAGAVWRRLLPEWAKYALLIPLTFAAHSLSLMLARSQSLVDCLVYAHALIFQPAHGAPAIFTPAMFRSHIYPGMALALLLEAFFYMDLRSRRWMMLGRWDGARACERTEAVLALAPVRAGLAGVGLGALAALLIAVSLAYRQYLNFVPFIYFNF